MKKNLHRLCLLLVGVLTMFSAQQARATHAIGGDMSYYNVGPGLYFVTYRFYRDCSGGPPVPQSFNLNYEATGCGPTNAPNAGGTRILAKRGIVVGNPYCRSQNAASLCDTSGRVPSNGFPNYQICTYAAVVVLGAGPGAECTEWVLSTDVNARPGTANLNGQATLYAEVRFNNKLVSDDSSPVFPSARGFQPLIFTCDTTYGEIRSDVRDPDNLPVGFEDTDSLVYSSLQPLSGPNMTIAYNASYTAAAPMRVWTGNPPTTGGGPVPIVNHPFAVDPITGTITFTSGLAIVGSPDDEENKFTVSIGVESWRKINGVRRKISTVRRDILVVIFRCPQRTQAPLVPMGGNGQVINTGLDTTVVINTTDTITVDACANTQIDIRVSDFNGDSVYVDFLASQLPGQAVLVVYSQTFAGGITDAVIRLNWAPDSSTIGGYFPVTIRLRDDGCPLPSRTDQPIILHVIRRQYADVGLFTSNNNGANDTLCVGQITKLVATTRLPATVGFPPVPAVYTYQWLMDADSTIVRTNGDTAVVRPRRTTRYYLNVYSPLRCMDTTSILVRVDPTNRATAQPDTVCRGQASVLNVQGRTRRVGPGGIPVEYTYRWVDSVAIRTGAPTTLSNDSIQMPTALPLVTTRYFATVYSSLGCTDTASIVVNVDAANIATAVAQVDSVCPGQPTALRVEGRTQQVGPGGVPIVYTYRWVDLVAIRTNTPTTLSDSTIQTPIATPQVTSRYFATVFSSVGCTDTASVVVYSTGPYPEIDLATVATQEYRQSTGLTYGENGVPSLTASNDNGSFTYSIRGGENLNVFNSDTTSATPTVRGLTRTTTFTLVVTNAYGCQKFSTFTIVVPLYVPNIITPNGDNKNDAFVVEGAQAPELTIYNRWGRQVRDWKSYDNKWKGEDVSAGTYYYLLRDKEQNKTYKGWLEIVK